MASNRTPHARLVQALHKILRDEGYQCTGTGEEQSQNSKPDSLPVCLFLFHYIFKVEILFYILEKCF